MEWSGVKIGGDFGVKFGVNFWSYWSVPLTRKSLIDFKCLTGFSGAHSIINRVGSWSGVE